MRDINIYEVKYRNRVYRYLSRTEGSARDWARRNLPKEATVTKLREVKLQEYVSPVMDDLD